jgi:hypothetical protein
MQKINRKKRTTNPKKRVGDIPPSSNPDIEKTPGEAPYSKPGVTPDIPENSHRHPEMDGCGDESAGRKPARLTPDG